MKKKIFSVLLCAVLCFSFFLTAEKPSFADSIGDYFYQVWRLNFVDDTPIVRFLNSVSQKKYDEKKWGYLNILREVFHDCPLDRETLSDVFSGMWLPNVTFSESDIKSMLGNFEDVDNFYSTIQPIVRELLVVSNYHTSIDDILDYVFMGRLTGFTDEGNPQIPSDDLKIELEKQNETISPKNRLYKKYSYREQSTLLKNRNVGLRNFARNVVVGNKTCVDTSLEDGFYIQMYYYDGTSFYYLPYQYHMYRTISWYKSGATPTGSLDDFRIATWYTDPIYYKTFDGVSLDTFEFKNFEFREYYPVIGHNSATGDIYGDLVNYDLQYLALGNGFDTSAGFGNAIASYSSMADMYEGISPSYSFSKFWNRMNPPRSVDGASDFYNSHWGYYLKSEDASSSSSYFDVCKHFTDSSRHMDVTIDLHDSSCSQNCDFGYLISSEPFTTTFQFDYTRFHSDSTVTISGDSVYDYSITDNSTGDTTTIYNYVTNNYNFPPKEETSEPTTSETSKPSDSVPSGSGNVGGSVGGNVTVGGTVKVDGQINVSIPDINININQNGGNGGNPEYSMPVTSTMDDYLEQALDDSTGFRKFLKEFFDFLPPPILVLLGTAITVAIIARIGGR